MIIVLLTIVLICLCVYNWLKRKNEPPGPVGWPLLGIVPTNIFRSIMGKNYSQSEFYKDMKRNYGTMWSMKLGNYREIGLASYDLIYDSLKNHAINFSYRPKIPLTEYLSKFGGILFMGGKLWKENRKETLKSLHKLGMNGSAIEEIVVNECQKLMKVIKRSSCESQCSEELYSKPVTNVICLLILNKSFDYDDEAFKKVIDNIQFIGKDESIHGILHLINILKYPIFQKIFKSVRNFIANTEQLEKWIETEFNFIEKKFNPSTDTPSCLVEYYLLRKSKIEPDKPEELYLYSKHQLFRNCFDLYAAGVDTTTHMLSWCTLMLGLKSEVQERIRDEMRNLKLNSVIYLKDTKDLHYFKAFLDECLRFFPVIPRIPHSVEAPMKFHGYVLKPGDNITVDYKSITRDCNVWENPDHFNPSRFMDDKDQFYKPNKKLISFGIGKRNCMGEQLARTELTIILLNVLSNFQIKLSQYTLENIDAIILGTDGFIYAPLKHEVVYIPI